jgi:hypothetical protein
MHFLLHYVIRRDCGSNPGRDFFWHQTGCETHWLQTALSPELNLTNHAHLAPRLRTRGAIPPNPHTSSWRGTWLSIRTASLYISFWLGNLSGSIRLCVVSYAFRKTRGENLGDVVVIQFTPFCFVNAVMSSELSWATISFSRRTLCLHCSVLWSGYAAGKTQHLNTPWVRTWRFQFLGSFNGAVSTEDVLRHTKQRGF